MIESKQRAQPPNGLAQIDQALRRRDLPLATRLAEAFNKAQPENVEGWLVRARVAQMAGDFSLMRLYADRASEMAPNHPPALLMATEALVHLGEIEKAQSHLQKMTARAKQDAVWLIKISETYTQCGLYEEASHCAAMAKQLAPQNMAILYHYATSLIALGALDEAEQQFDLLIAQNPDDYDAWYNRAGLRKQTAENNHIADLRAMLERPLKHPMGVVQLNYALAKELEDIGAYEQSFTALKKGADARRKMLSYRVESDITAMEKIATTFDQAFVDRPHHGDRGAGPVFIVGFPRSGTTLIDRILSAHPAVESLGELTDFPMALTSLCKAEGGKEGLIEAAAKLDMGQLGAAYRARVQQRAKQWAHGSRYYIDKTPANFLYIGLICACLPDAKIIHLNRDLADVGFAMYKTLFRMGYPFSYDLDDLARYIKAKEKLMRHWRKILPGHILDIDYENMVANQEDQTRRLLAHLDLDWHPACLDFHKNKSPSATASAAQVRQPLYSSAIGRWKHYAKELAPLTKSLGIIG